MRELPRSSGRGRSRARLRPKGVSPRDWSSRGLVPTDVQKVWSPPAADERYVADRVWLRAILDACPFHPEGGCGVSPHGSYPRVQPEGVRVPRFRCPLAGQTISLLPVFLAARYRGTLDEIERVVDAVESATSLTAAAERLRPADEEDAVTSISAMRWVRRRVCADATGAAGAPGRGARARRAAHARGGVDARAQSSTRSVAPGEEVNRP